MRAALVQFASDLDVEANTASITRLLAAIEPQSVDLVVLPEAAMCDFGPPSFDVNAVSQPLDGPFVEFLGEQAQRLDSFVVAGIFERSAHGHPDRPFNTLVVVDPAGQLVAHYRKIHLFDSFGYRESDRFTSGPVAPTVSPIAGEPWGLLTCYDIRFPELARALVDQGARGLIVPAAWLAGENKGLQWETLVRARAIENVCPVLAVGQPAPRYCGSSLAMDPLGVTLAQAGTSEEVVFVEIDQQATLDSRQTNPALEHRRLR